MPILSNSPSGGGQNGFTSTFEKFEFQPGGEWRFTFHGPNGADYPNFNRFLEIVPSKRLVLEHVQEGHDFLLTFDFEDLGTEMGVTWTMRLPESSGEKLQAFIANANQENFERLAAHLEQQSAASEAA